VLNYVSRAAVDFDQRRARREAPAATSQPQTRQPKPTWPRGQGRLAILTTDQYQFRFGQAKAELFRQNPFLAQRWKEGSSIHKRMIRSRLVMALDAEVMDLVPLNFLANWLPVTDNRKAA
jgi:hypothetical protein